MCVDRALVPFDPDNESWGDEIPEIRNKFQGAPRALCRAKALARVLEHLARIQAQKVNVLQTKIVG